MKRNFQVESTKLVTLRKELKRSVFSQGRDLRVSRVIFEDNTVIFSSCRLEGGHLTLHEFPKVE